jgi:hypothetical protein
LRFFGFSNNSLEYINSKHIFSNFREKLKIVFANLISKNLIGVKSQDKILKYFLTDKGKKIVNKFAHEYYKAYRLSAKYILNILRTCNRKEIIRYQETWFENSRKFAIA